VSTDGDDDGAVMCLLPSELLHTHPLAHAYHNISPKTRLTPGQ
jgi:hypothetical protein